MAENPLVRLLSRINATLPGHRAHEICRALGVCRGVCQGCSSLSWDRQERLATPLMRAGVSIVIPSFARPHNLYSLLPGLLRHRAMQHPASEIIVSHASARSWREHAQIDASVRAACVREACEKAQSALRLCGSCASPPWRVRHLDHTAQNRAFRTALRFVAANEARNGAIVHMDDDLIPTPALLDKLVWRAVRASREGTMALFGAKRRSCNASGYALLAQPGHNATLVLTNLASSTAQTTAAFVRMLNRSYLPLLQHTAGNGEDLVYAHFVRASAGVVRQVRGLIKSIDQGGATKNAHSHSDAHLEARGAICACLARRMTGGALAQCVRGRTARADRQRATEPGPDGFYPPEHGPARGARMALGYGGISMAVAAGSA